MFTQGFPDTSASALLACAVVQEIILSTLCNMSSCSILHEVHEDGVYVLSSTKVVQLRDKEPPQHLLVFSGVNRCRGSVLILEEVWTDEAMSRYCTPDHQLRRVEKDLLNLIWSLWSPVNSGVTVHCSNKMKVGFQ